MKTNTLKLLHLYNETVCSKKVAENLNSFIHCICKGYTKLPFTFHVPFDPQQNLSGWNLWDSACSARTDGVFCDW